jgi:hypothetical protein
MRLTRLVLLRGLVFLVRWGRLRLVRLVRLGRRS